MRIVITSSVSCVFGSVVLFTVVGVQAENLGVALILFAFIWVAVAASAFVVVPLVVVIELLTSVLSPKRTLIWSILAATTGIVAAYPLLAQTRAGEYYEGMTIPFLAYALSAAGCWWLLLPSRPCKIEESISNVI